MSRTQVLALALLTCVPIPLLSLAATVVPLPGILERAAATFVPFVAPALGDDEGRVARESASAVHPLGIVHRPSEQSASSRAPRTAPTRNGGFTRGERGELDSPFAPEGNPTTQPGNSSPDSTPTGGAGEQGESPPSGADPTIPPAEGPSGDAPTNGNTGGTGGSPAPSGSGDTPSGDAPGQTSGHGKAGSPPGQGDTGPPSDKGGGNSGGSGNGSGQGAPAKSEPPAGGGASPGAGGRGR